MFLIRIMIGFEAKSFVDGFLAIMKEINHQAEHSLF